MHADPPPPTVGGDARADLQQIIMRALAKDPAARDDTAAPMRQDLERVRRAPGGD